MTDTAATAASARIMLVDDETANLRLLEDLLAREGYDNVVGTSDPRRALDLFTGFEPDLVLLDLMMPGFDGFAVLEQLGRRIGPDDYLPIMVLTADNSRDARRRALALGARDFMTKPIDVVEAMLRVANLIDTRQLFQRLRAAR